MWKTQFMFLIATMLFCCSCVPGPGAGLTPDPRVQVSPTVHRNPTDNNGIPSNSGIETDCYQVISEPHAKVEIDGTILSSDRSSYKNAPYLEYREVMSRTDGGTWITLADLHDPFLYMTISPGHQKMAYYRPERETLEIANINKPALKSFTWNKGKWSYITGWLDEQHLVIELSGGAPAALLVLDIESGEEKILYPKFPDIYTLDRMFDWDGWGETVYNAALNRAVYAGYVGTTYRYVLWDLEYEKPVTFLESTNNIKSLARTPRWSPDGSQFLVPSPVTYQNQGSEELFRVSADGTTIQLTDLTSLYGAVGFSQMNWSPDGRYIAFYFFAAKYFQGERLAIYDTYSQQAFDLCVPALQNFDYDPTFPPRRSTLYELIPPPIWSPNSRQILVENRFSNDRSRLILVDIYKESAIEIGENLEPIGWVGQP